MRAVKLVVLAAGHGTRFGGLKQVAAVGPSGEAIMDRTVLHAHDSGVEGVVLVVRPEIRAEIEAHVRARWPRALPVELVCQPARPGTAYAVLCTRPVVDGPFAVANADDLYEPDAFSRLREHFAPHAISGTRPEHVLVAYELARTLLGASEVKRGICTIGEGGELRGVADYRVRHAGEGWFSASPVERALHRDTPPQEDLVLGADAPVSMNLWGFHPSVYDVLAAAVDPFEPAGPDREVLLPEVLGESVETGECRVQVLRTTSRCYGITHAGDVELVHAYLETCERAGENDRPLVGSGA